MSSRNEQQWDVMLKRLASRDGSVELSRGVSNDDAAIIMYRSRVFEILEGGCIIVETPKQAVFDRSFRVGDDIDLTLMVNNERMLATCTLQDTLTYELNASLKVTCYRLSPGRRPVREQRRSFYRVNVAAMDLEPTKLRSEVEETVFECSVRLVNISAGGIGVSIRAARNVLKQLKRTRNFQCTAWLSDDEAIEMPVRVAHINALGDDGLYLGLKFDFDNDAEANAHEQLMQQRCTEIQRMQLQRRRA
ncbi:MAG: PilZ domain-containing protein [Planctomycetota bacterium]